MLSLNEFNVLVEYERNMADTAREFLHLDKEIFDGVVNSLCEKGFIAEMYITDEGRAVLEPYRVKRAILMAAGFGSRMVPLTYSIPKPLICVNGKRIIETLLDAVIAAGIDEIYIIRGYMAETFDMLKTKYPMIRFLENPDYNKANNISSAYVMRNLMEQAYVMESDLVLYNKRVIRKYEYATNYLGRATKETDDWCFRVKDGYVEELLVGGSDVSHMYGISFWNAKDAAKMQNDIATVYFGPGGNEKYWDEVPMRCLKENYKIMVKPVYDGDIIEIDTFDELCCLDTKYKV